MPMKYLDRWKIENRACLGCIQARNKRFPNTSFHKLSMKNNKSQTPQPSFDASPHTYGKHLKRMKDWNLDNIDENEQWKHNISTGLAITKILFTLYGNSMSWNAKFWNFNITDEWDSWRKKRTIPPRCNIKQRSSTLYGIVLEMKRNRTPSIMKIGSMSAVRSLPVCLCYGRTPDI